MDEMQLMGGGLLYARARRERVMGWLGRDVQCTATLRQREHACTGAERSEGGQRPGLAWRRHRKGFRLYVGVGVVSWIGRTLDVATRQAGMHRCIASTWLGECAW
jgi:hypothetical protein